MLVSYFLFPTYLLITRDEKERGGGGGRKDGKKNADLCPATFLFLFLFLFCRVCQLSGLFGRRDVKANRALSTKSTIAFENGKQCQKLLALEVLNSACSEKWVASSLFVGVGRQSGSSHDVARSGIRLDYVHN